MPDAAPETILRGGRAAVLRHLHPGRPSEARDMGMVFQSYASFPHLTAAGNVGFILETRCLPRAEREA